MNEIVQWVTGVGIGGILLAIVNGLFSKRKLSAEATKIITDAASGVVQNLRDENARVIASNTALGVKVDGLTRRVELQQGQIEDGQRIQRAQSDALAIHAFWDTQAVAICAEQGIDLPAPPPLSTPRGN
jgi:hypothetical protein